MATTPENSDRTRIKLRIEYWKNKANRSGTSHAESLQPQSLFPFDGNNRQPRPRGLAFDLIDYLELVDWSGRAIREDKRGSIPESTPPILQRLNISPKHWVELTTGFESRFKGIVGTVDSVKKLCSHFGLKRTANCSNSKILYS